MKKSTNVWIETIVPDEANGAIKGEFENELNGYLL